MSKFLTKKLVTVKCARPFRIGNINYVGTISRVVLNVDIISKCIENKARVVEHLMSGEDLPLNFSNYNTDNGSYIYDENQDINLNNAPKVPLVDAKGTIIKEDISNRNKKEHTPLTSKPIRYEKSKEKDDEVKVSDQKKIEVNDSISTQSIEIKDKEEVKQASVDYNVKLTEEKKDSFDYDSYTTSSSNNNSNHNNKKKNRY